MKEPTKVNTFDAVSDCTRRNDSRLAQSQYRAKIKKRFEGLQHSFDRLQLKIEQYESSAEGMYQLVHYVKGHAAQVRWEVVRRLYRIFEFGIGEKVSKQFEFMHANLIEKVCFNGGRMGKHVFWNQLMMLTTLYTKVQFEMVNMDVFGMNHDIIHVVAKVHLQLNEKVILLLYPSLNKQDKMLAFLIGKWMSVQLNQVYYFEGPFIQRIDTNCDWLHAWRLLCRSYKDVSMILKNSNMDNHLFMHLDAMPMNTVTQPH